MNAIALHRACINALPNHAYLIRACYKGVLEERILKCKMACTQMMECQKHPCRRTCGAQHTHAACKALVSVLLPCGHTIKKPCHQDLDSLQCEQEVS